MSRTFCTTAAQLVSKASRVMLKIPPKLMANPSAPIKCCASAMVNFRFGAAQRFGKNLTQKRQQLTVDL